MSFLDHLHLTARVQAQDNIIALQQKLRQKREIDFEIENLMYEGIIRGHHLRQYQKGKQSQLHQEKVFAESELNHRSYIEEKLLSERIRYQNNAIANESARTFGQLQIQKLREDEILALKNAFINRKIASDLPYDKYQLADEEQLRWKAKGEIYKDAKLSQQIEELELLQKYEDGTRARQIQLMLQRSRRRSQQQNYYSPYQRQSKQKLPDAQIHNEKKAQNIQNSLDNSHRHSPEKGLSNSIQASPYSILKKEKKTLSPASPLKCENQYKKYQADNLQNQDQNISFFNVHNEERKQGKNRERRNDKSYSHTQRNPRQRNNRQNKFNTIKTNTSFLVGGHSLLSLQQKCLKRIQNRVRLSKHIYKDSKFRNVRHEINHLEMTYDNEKRVRKQVKDKLNNHPTVLRKHSMVVS